MTPARADALIERCACGAWTWRPGTCSVCVALAARLVTDRATASLDRARRSRAADLADRLHAANIHRTETLGA